MNHQPSRPKDRRGAASSSNGYGSRGDSPDGPEPLPDLPSLGDDEPTPSEDDPSGGGLAGSNKTPPCAHHGRYYCSYKEDYPMKGDYCQFCYSSCLTVSFRFRFLDFAYDQL